MLNSLRLRLCLPTQSPFPVMSLVSKVSSLSPDLAIDEWMDGMYGMYVRGRVTVALDVYFQRLSLSLPRLMHKQTNKSNR